MIEQAPLFIRSKGGWHRVDHMKVCDGRLLIVCSQIEHGGLSASLVYADDVTAWISKDDVELLNEWMPKSS